METVSISGPTEVDSAKPGRVGPLLPFPRTRDPERYVVLGEHGRGGLGRVSRAHDRELGRDVAIKEAIDRDLVSEARFLREALITARLEHPGIVAVHEAGRWPDGTPFYAMKLVSGRPLREVIDELPTADDRLELLHHLIAVTDAIAYAHGRRIVHRDLKPSNIIVGEFGETIVIDWGLAKDLSIGTEEPRPAAGSPEPERSSDSGGELTSAGSVLGTRAYMAPEQARGEAVDQRADVYAIGAMLWELCALGRHPPVASAQRRRELRGAGIDQDLATIIDKALAPDPAGRYADAGALARDLKAFKSGSRISARRYTVVAVLRHWISRRRALAITIAAAAVLGAAGIAVFVRSIATERDRTATANNKLILEHAEQLRHTDPTAAAAVLATYTGDDTVRRDRVLAELRGLGIAQAIYTPHTDAIGFLHGERGGAFLSVGEDRQVRLNWGPVSVMLASDVSSSMALAYAPSRNRLAYATATHGITVLDIETQTRQRLEQIGAIALALAPDGSRIAAIDRRGALSAWSLGSRPSPISVRPSSEITGIQFATSTRVIAQIPTGLRGIPLDRDGGAPAELALPDLVSFDAQPDAVVAGTRGGDIVALSSELTILGRAEVCRQLESVRLIPHGDRIAFACRDGVAGVARRGPAGAVTVVDTFTTKGSSSVAPDASGQYVSVLDESNTAALYDTETRLLHRYDGNAGRPSFVAPPTPALDRVLVGDINGTVRVWASPARVARVMVKAGGPIYGFAFARDSKSLLTATSDKLVRWTQLADGTTIEMPGHTKSVFGVRAAPDGETFYSISRDHTIRTWRARDGGPLRTFASHAGAINDAEYIERGRRIVSAGEDGRLLAWSPEGGEPTTVYTHRTEIVVIESLSGSDRLVIADVNSEVWEISLRGTARRIHDGKGGELTLLRASPDGRYLATGTNTGVVTIYETATWRVVQTSQHTESIRLVQFDPRDRDFIVLTESGRTQSNHVEILPLEQSREIRWRAIPVPTYYFNYAPDGETLGFVCKDGGVWLYAIARDAWVYARDHDVDAVNGGFSPDGSRYASTDVRGTVVVRDVAATFASAAR